MRLTYSLLLLVALGWTASQAAEVGSPAPGCEVPTLAGDARVDPAALAGKVVYLDFWASWCGPCAQSFPILDKMHLDLKDQGLEIVAINLDEEVRDAEGFLTKYPVQFTIGSDPDSRCARLYQVRGMPTSYLIDRAGRIRDIHEGFEISDAGTLRTQVEDLLSEPWGQQAEQTAHSAGERL